MRSRILRWGNSLAVRIPQAFAREVRLEDQSEIDLRTDDGRIVIEPIDLTPLLDELLAGVTPQNAHRDLYWRPTDGRGMGTEG